MQVIKRVKQRILMMFAHPDDELLWMGGTLLKYRSNFKADFVCMTMPFNKARVKGMFHLDRYFDTGAIMCLGYEDDTAVWREGAEVDFDDLWMECIDFERYDLIFSHNSHGEYYHPHHFYIYEKLKELGIPFFSFGHLGEYDFEVHLEPGDIKRKQNAVENLYYSEYSRCMHKFTYWNTDREKFKFEIPEGRDEIRNIMEGRIQRFLNASCDA